MTPSGAPLPPAPAGFERRDGEGAALYVRPDWAAAFEAAGLVDPSRWPAPRAPEPGRSGRGALSRIVLPGRAPLLAKAMRRGGLAAALWDDRFLGSRRLLRNLEDPDEAARRGIPTPRAAAMLLRAEGRALVRAWLAVEEVPGAVDLSRRWGESPPEADEERAVLSFVRAFHDAGLEHRDLNLGNLLTRPRSGGPPELLLVDLDRARWHPGPLPVPARRRGLRRLARSCAKVLGWDVTSSASRVAAWPELYAGGDASLAREIGTAWAGDRMRLALRRLGRAAGGGRT